MHWVQGCLAWTLIMKMSYANMFLFYILPIKNESSPEGARPLTAKVASRGISQVIFILYSHISSHAPPNESSIHWPSSLVKLPIPSPLHFYLNASLRKQRTCILLSDKPRTNYSMDQLTSKMAEAEMSEQRTEQSQVSERFNERYQL